MDVATRTSKPRVILGLMTFGPDTSAGARITDIDTYKSVLNYFQSQGYNELDTARCYAAGKQEGWTKSAGWKESGFTLATKWYPYDDDDKTGAHAADRLEKEFNTSLSELGTDCIDIFYLHAPDRTTPFQEPLRKMNELYKQGRFRRLGLSNYTAFEVAEIVLICKANGWVQPTIFQCMYNAINRSIEPELIPACRRYGLDIVIYNPIAGGILSGKYSTLTADTIPTEGRYSNNDAALGSMYRKRYFNDATLESLLIIESAANPFNLSLLEIAFRWLTHHSALNIKSGGNDGIVIGVSSQSQLEQNLKHLEKGPLPSEVLQALDEVWDLCKGTAAVYWHNDLEYTYDVEKALETLD